MIRHIANKATALMLAALTLFSMTIIGGMSAAPAKAAEVTEDSSTGDHETFGSQTLLESAGITYAAYMKWLEDHDDRGEFPDYYLGTPYAGYFPDTPFETDDYRTPNGEEYSEGDVPPSYAPYNGHAMNCTGFLWNVLVRSGETCGAPQSKLDALPVTDGHVIYWQENDIYRYYFSGENCIYDAVESGVLEKGDIIWMNGTEDWHCGIFYGDNSHDNKFWHSGAQQGLDSVNRISEIESCGDATQLFVLKAYNPSRPPKIAKLAIKTIPENPSVAGNGNYSLLGTKFCVFTSYTDAQNASENHGDKASWSKSIGTIALDNNGFGMLRTGTVPSYSELVNSGGNHEYFKRSTQVLDATIQYYAVQLGAGNNYITDKTVYPLIDARDSSSSFWSDYNLVRSKSGLRYYVVNTYNRSYGAALRVQVASTDKALTDGNPNYSLMGSRFSIYSSYEDAASAAAAPAGSDERSKQTSSFCGQVITNSSGIGWLRKGEIPSVEAFNDPETQADYFNSHIDPLLIGKYYAVQTLTGKGYEISNLVYTFETTNSALAVDGGQAIVFRASNDGLSYVFNKPAEETPTDAPTSPTEQPTSEPTSPTEQPTSEPTSPTEQPTSEPTSPTEQPTSEPTSPTEQPTSEPTSPTEQPTSEPTSPTEQPTSEPTSPTEQPTSEPTSPTEQPTSEPTSPTEPAKTYLCGDIDADGYITISDVTNLQRIIAEFTVHRPDDYEDDALFLKAADTDGNGIITIKDATIIQRYLAELSLDPDIPIGKTFTIDDVYPVVPEETSPEESSTEQPTGDASAPVNNIKTEIAWLHRVTRI